MKKNAVNKTGFTLIELLVVVLIIGILSAIALPGYRKAVERSRVSDALTTMQAVAKSEHGWYLTNNSYTKDFANLDIEINGTMNEGALETDFYTYELLDTGILAGRNNREYSIYQDYETKQIMCTPGNHYICENLGAFTKEPCERVGMAWANTDSTCYADNEARCKGLYDDETWNGDFCGYLNSNSMTLNEGMECRHTGLGRDICLYSQINNGGICIAKGERSCSYSTINVGGVCDGAAYFSCSSSTIRGGLCKTTSSYGCAYSTITGGGICDGTGGLHGCYGATINNGVCISGCENSIINSGGVCEGGPSSCYGSTVNTGGECKGNCNYAIVKGGICSGTCPSARVYEGGKCTGECSWAIINNGGKCISNATNKCSGNVSYNGTGCCEGDYCGNKPKCHCPIDETTGMHKTSC